MKFAGYDHIVLLGKATRPVYLWIQNEQVEIRDAASIWGKDTYEMQDIIRKEVNNPDAKVLCIGPAGENRVRFATIQHGLGHAAGRTGMGAVMGSKNLKAIAVRGSNSLSMARPADFLGIAAELEAAMKTAPFTKELSEIGVSRHQDKFAALFGEEGPKQYDIFKKFNPKRTGCYGCPVQCMDLYEGEDEKHQGAISCELYPSYSVAPDIYDPAASLECAILSQRYGIDCVSVSEIIVMAMKCYQKGIINDKDTGGIPLVFGSAEAIHAMLEQITFRRGLGDVLAEGMLAAARHIGQGAENYAHNVKGMPMVETQAPGWLPNQKGASLAAAVGARGDTMRSLGSLAEHFFDRERVKELIGTEKAADRKVIEGKPELVVFMEDIVTMCDMLSTCKYTSLWTDLNNPLTPEMQARLYTAGSGQETTAEELFGYAKKIRTLERAYEAGEGVTRAMDTLTERFLDHPIKQGVFAGDVLKSAELEEMKSRYYALREWDVDTGVPTEETLRKMELDDVVERLKGLDRLPPASKIETVVSGATKEELNE
jgi:aldehyde:ferredoxin oxidoreductase